VSPALSPIKLKNDNFCRGQRAEKQLLAMEAALQTPLLPQILVLRLSKNIATLTRHHQTVVKYIAMLSLDLINVITIPVNYPINVPWLVALKLLKNISQWDGLSHILWKIKHVPNHQPVPYHYYPS